ncbi:DUF6934 family protein [Dyadobacter sp. OTU695]|uniref:DUF6934 family protein n=1 Tax=Dyadobacter sp. OTU695 TaxID=3043860 RepID=UPI00313B1EEC
MQLYEAYPFVLNEGKTHYHFQSIGKRGVFEKAIEFSPLNDNVYNLALLDFNPETGEYSDDTITDNGDMREVLATVLKIALQFLAQNPYQTVFIQGNSDSKTRLYQIALGKLFPDVHVFLLIKGYKNGQWSDFEPNGSFESFLIERKLLD